MTTFFRGLATGLLYVSTLSSPAFGDEPAAAIPPPSADDRVVSFETAASLADLQVNGAGSVALADHRYIHGKHALDWTWDGAATLVLRRPTAIYTQKEARGLRIYGTAVFASWFYLETPIPDGTLRIEFGRGEDTTADADCWFEMGLDFTGWRAARVAFDRDMQGKHRGRFDWVRVVAPAGGGRLYIDGLIPMTADDRRNQWRDAQLPFLRQHMDFEPAQILREADVDAPTAEEIAGGEVITRRVEEALRDTVADTTLDLDALEREYAALELIADEHGVRGVHIAHHGLLGSGQVVVDGRGLMSTRDMALTHRIQLRAATELLFRLGVAARQATEPAERQLWAERFILLSRHLLDQGWVEGSGRGTTHHFGYASRHWFKAVLLMRQELAEAGLLEPATSALRWYMLSFLDIAAPPPEPPITCNMDYLSTVARSQLYLIAAYPDGPIKIELIRRFAAYQNAILSQPTPGTLGGFKVDGTLFHHRGHYPAYGFGGLGGAVDIMSLLHGTAFELDSAAHENVRRAFRSAWLYTNPQIAQALCGRHPLRESLVSFGGDGDPHSSFYTISRKLAMMGHPTTGEALDREMAGIYLACLPAADERVSRKVFGEVVTPVRRPAGHWSFNYGAFGIHRYAGRMVTLKGFNEDVWATEIYAGYQKPGGDNNFGVYQSHGTIQVMMPGGAEASGMQADGWDWSLNPGATTIHYPTLMLKNPAWRTFMPRAGGRWTLNGETNVAGSGHLDNTVGVFMMELVPTNPENPYSQPPFDAAFRARTSAFAFGDRVVCLGSGIVNTTADYPTRTTLFQLGLGDDMPSTWFGADAPITDFPARAETASPVWLTDHLGQGYIVETGARVTLQRHTQHSRNDRNTEDTTGRFATAYIDHGTAPTDAGYVYTLLLDSTPQATAAYAADLATAERRPYTILQRHNRAHILRDNRDQTTGYAFFDPTLEPLANGPVRGISQPAIVITKPVGDGLKLAVCDPLLHLAPDDGGSQSVEVEVLVRGHWAITAGGDYATATAEGADTLLRVSCQHGLSRQISLAPTQYAATPSGFFERVHDGRDAGQP